MVAMTHSGTPEPRLYIVSAVEIRRRDVAGHGQEEHAVRFEWGPTGAAAVAEGVDLAVVVDVLSFTTTLTVAVERGITVLPYRWKDDRAAAYAVEQRATLAVGRL